MALSNENLAKLVALQRKNQDILKRTYNPLSGQSMSGFRESVGWNNPTTYRGKEVRAFTNKADSPLVEKYGAKVIQEPKAETNYGTPIVVKDHTTFNANRVVEDIMKRDRGAIFKHTFKGKVNSEKDLTPDQVELFNSNLKSYRQTRLAEAKEAKENAKARAEAGKVSVSDQDKAYGYNRKWFESRYGNVDATGAVTYAPVGPEDKAQMEAEAKKAGLFVKFVETEPLVKDNPGLFTGNTETPQWVVQQIGPQDVAGKRGESSQRAVFQGSQPELKIDQTPRVAPNGKSYISLGNGKFQEVITSKPKLKAPPKIKPVSTGGASRSFQTPESSGPYLIDPRTVEQQAAAKEAAKQELIDLAAKLGVSAKNIKAVGDAAKAAGSATWKQFRAITSAYMEAQNEARKTLPAYGKTI